MSRVIGTPWTLALTSLSGAVVINDSVSSGGAFLSMNWTKDAGVTDAKIIVDSQRSGSSPISSPSVHGCTNEANRILVGLNGTGNGLKSMNFNGSTWSVGPSTFNYVSTYGYVNEMNGNIGVAYDYVNGDTYYIGGFNSGYRTSVVKHTGSTDSFTTRATYPLSTGTGWPLCGVISSNRIISIGGVSGSNPNFSYRSEAYIYNMSSNSWSSVGTYPGGAVYGGGCAWDGNDYVYTIGGYGSTNPLSNAYRYTISTNTWTSITSTPFSGYCTAFCSPDGDLYGNGSTGLYRWTGSAWSLVSSSGISVSTGCTPGRVSSGAVYWPTISSSTITMRAAV